MSDSIMWVSNFDRLPPARGASGPATKFSLKSPAPGRVFLLKGPFNGQTISRKFSIFLKRLWSNVAMVIYLALFSTSFVLFIPQNFNTV